jgi:hypothetical protein
MKTPAENHRIAPALELRTRAVEATRTWLPTDARHARALDLSHWQSRAARGFTWNSHGATQRRRTH